MRRSARGGEGQASVELALALPLLAMLLLGLVQLGLLVRDQILVVHAAREAVREAAVNPSAGASKRAAAGSSGLIPGRLDVSLSGRGGPGSRVRATVRYDSPTDVPLIGPVLGDFHLTANATMRVEK